MPEIVEQSNEANSFNDFPVLSRLAARRLGAGWRAASGMRDRLGGELQRPNRFRVGRRRTDDDNRSFQNRHRVVLSQELAHCTRAMIGMTG